MPFKPLVTAGIENVLNAFLYRAPALKAARQRLNGKVLRIVLKEFSTPLVLVFSERQLDVLGEWEGDADCSVITRMSVLPKLRDRQQLTALIRSGELEVEGDIRLYKISLRSAIWPSSTRRNCLPHLLATLQRKGSAKPCMVVPPSCVKACNVSSVMRQRC
ncbi:protein YigP [Enterobacter cloacae]|uniref:Protein YigP n=1 Tax=Enterobacter cloacae TaxID=550 RepID=A0A377LS96_ENTCL|nr:protein YigP [Enterobacter cloacae]